MLQLLQRGPGAPPRPPSFLHRVAGALRLGGGSSGRVREEAEDGTVTAVTLSGLYTARAAIVAMPPHLAGRIAYDPPMPAARDQLTQRMPMVGAKQGFVKGRGAALFVLGGGARFLIPPPTAPPRRAR